MSQIFDWDPLAGGNQDPPPDGFPEGMQKDDLNDSSREVMAAIRVLYDAMDYLMVLQGLTVTREGPTTLRVAGDLSAIGKFLNEVDGNGRLLETRCRLTPSKFEGFVTGVTVDGPDALIEVDLDQGATVPVGTTGIIKTPAGRTLQRSAYLPLPAEVFYNNQSGVADQDVISATATAVTGLSGLVIPGADGTREYTFEAYVGVEIAEPSESGLVLALHIGPLGTEADPVAYETWGHAHTDAGETRYMSLYIPGSAKFTPDTDDLATLSVYSGGPDFTIHRSFSRTGNYGTLRVREVTSL